AFACLTALYVVSDFSVVNVATNSHSAKPMLYKLSGVWGNHEGSLVLWILILTVFAAAIALLGRNLPATFRARVLAVQAMIAVGFLLFTLLTSNPFLRILPPPMQGVGLNPLLQDPGLAFHPPFLYLGYVGFSVAFSFAVAALIEGRVDPAWARWVRPWTLAAWISLTIGIALGSWWAYHELGWGGWWFWDPVENASFMPWLAGTALLHSAIVVEKRDTLKSWTILLAIVTFSLSLLGTFIVRSGIITSVHAFASDPTRGVFILGFLVLVVGGSLTLYAVRASSLTSGGYFQPVSRESALVLNNVLLAVATGTVLLGTLYPLLEDLLTGQQGSVGPPYYAMTFVPLMIPLLVAMGLGPLLRWKRGDIGYALRRVWIGYVIALVVAAIYGYVQEGGPALALFGMALGTWLVIAALVQWADQVRIHVGFKGLWGRLRRVRGGTWGMTLAHLGLGVAILGMVASTAWEDAELRVMQPGERVTVAGYDFTFHGAVPLPGPNYTTIEGRFTVTRNGRAIADLRPESRVYPDPAMATIEAAVHPRLSGDLYAVIGEQSASGGWAARLYFKPLLSWIWAGTAIMALGGLVSLCDRRWRVGVAARATAHPRNRTSPATTPGKEVPAR
ncbi:MAG: heme lyase CcmF/NrfE family subunit, partial [Sphingomonadales bacterium]